MKKEVIILSAIIALVAIGGVVGASYYRNSVQKPPDPGKTARGELVRPDSVSMGPADAKVTLVEFYDPECESCAAFHVIVTGLLKEFDGRVRFVARYATFHKNAKIAAIYTEAAGEQGKYWEMRAKLFENQPEWGEKHGNVAATLPVARPEELFQKYAGDLGLNVEQLKISVGDPKHAAKIDRDMRDVDLLKVQRTPTFYVNGRLLARLNQQDLRNLIKEELDR